MKKSKSGWRIAGTVCLLLAAAAALGIEFVYHRLVLPRGYRWLFDWMGPAILAAGAVSAAGAVILNLKKKRRTKAVCLALFVTAGAAWTLASALLSPVKISISLSPEKNIAAVVETDRQSGQRKLCRVSCLVFRYPKDILPFASDCDIKYDWLEEDVCALTGRDTAGNVQQYLATYGARGSLTSYMDPYVPMLGNWQGYDAAENEWRVTVSSGVGVVKGGEQWLFGESECERYGTIGMTLGKGSDARFSLIMNKDCREEDGMLMDGGTLTLCRISMDEEEKIILKKADEAASADWSDYGAAAAALEEQREMEALMQEIAREEAEKAEEGKQSVILQSGGTYTEYDDRDYEKEVVLEGEIRYRMIVLDAALGSRWYGLIKSRDGGKNWEVVSDDPFGQELGQGVDFTFLDENFGFATLMHNGGDTARLYVTEDGGRHYEPVEIEHKTETDSSGAIWAPYDYPRMPYEKDGKIYVLCGQGADGDYNGGDAKETARYRSEDHGHTFVFDGMEPTR